MCTGSHFENALSSWLCLSASLCVSVSASLPLSLWLFLALSLCLSVCLSLPPPCLSISLPLSLGSLHLDLLVC